MIFVGRMFSFIDAKTMCMYFIAATSERGSIVEPSSILANPVTADGESVSLETLIVLERG